MKQYMEIAYEAAKKAAEMSSQELGRYIDQSVLKPEFTTAEVKKYIQEGIDFNCKTVCINPAYLDIARKMCKGTNTGICVVCDFPLARHQRHPKLSRPKLSVKTVTLKISISSLTMALSAVDNGRNLKKIFRR